MKMNVNIKQAKKCAFCEHWYDPANSTISPQNPKIGIWQITDTDKKCKCLKKNVDMRAGSFCSYYECKL